MRDFTGEMRETASAEQVPSMQPVPLKHLFLAIVDSRYHSKGRHMAIFRRKP